MRSSLASTNLGRLNCGSFCGAMLLLLLLFLLLKPSLLFLSKAEEEVSKGLRLGGAAALGDLTMELRSGFSRRALALKVGAAIGSSRSEMPDFLPLCFGDVSSRSLKKESMLSS